MGSAYPRPSPSPCGKKFFGSFFQERTASFPAHKPNPAPPPQTASFLYARRPKSTAPFGGLVTMADIIVIVLGTGGILLMAAYAALCERI